ncbi:hypothetical protein [Paracoccus marcusii]|uniref:Uncharacterized protein n=1 Tax=Paracoccus marcusii TaxID=59779 RepID=A0ABY7UQF5_9RHOB|nr:hypothetical protein [Paracoccus marcusii]WDA11651.1 hypothetical protein PRL19_10100 [Paracoccus marcusii]
MSIHFASMTVSEITDRAHKLMQEGTALALLANALTEFEEATGRTLFVSEADQGTQYVGSPAPVEIRLQPDHGLTLPEVVAKVDTPAETAPVQEPIKNAAPAIAKPVPPKPTAAQDPIKKPAARPFAAPAAARPQTGSSNVQEVHNAPKPAKPHTIDRPWGALSLPERSIVKHLEKMAPAFTLAEDLTIAELLIGGNKIEAVALQLEVQASMALARWKAFLCGEVLGENGKPSMDGQQRLLAALRYRKDTAA